MESPPSFLLAHSLPLTALRQVGVPTRIQSLNGIPVTHWDPVNFHETVMANLNVTFDFLCVHDGYLPIPPVNTPRDQLYLLSMAATAMLDDAMSYYRLAVANLSIPQQSRNFKFAHTEFALFPDTNSLTLWSSRVSRLHPLLSCLSNPFPSGCRLVHVQPLELLRVSR